MKYVYWGATAMIDQDYPLTEAQIDFYRTNGFVQLNDVITGAALQAFREAVAEAVATETPAEASAEPKTGYNSIFIQKVNLWQRHPKVSPFTLCRRFGNLAARLAGMPMRLWHDQALFKEPRTGSKTPWHQDTHYWPHREKKNQLSIWIALQDATPENGCLSFLPGTQHLAHIQPVNLGHPQELKAIAPETRGLQAKMCPLKAGSCTFHNGFTFHYAGPNKTDAMREAFAILYMPDGTTFNDHKHICTETLTGRERYEPSDKDFPKVSDVVFEEQMTQV